MAAGDVRVGDLEEGDLGPEDLEAEDFAVIAFADAPPPAAFDAIGLVPFAAAVVPDAALPADGLEVAAFGAPLFLPAASVFAGARSVRLAVAAARALSVGAGPPAAVFASRGFDGTAFIFVDRAGVVFAAAAVPAVALPARGAADAVFEPVASLGAALAGADLVDADLPAPEAALFAEAFGVAGGIRSWVEGVVEPSAGVRVVRRLLTACPRGYVRS
ncbi:hypothetical protein NVS89_00465 [Ancylobacter sp. MQZ15Z-1]|uniref:Uncharacterized protein n=1 Tax=Ancylobacter mangrovi TaxID=2972472 RepID=A0A9X2T081_9HYPH|nr:hypothetical protein [Ancylobacter mangrovi]MCS0493550.1 hypothetical protein [Ancylobacter mangrovi]